MSLPGLEYLKSRPDNNIRRDYTVFGYLPDARTALGGLDCMGVLADASVLLVNLVDDLANFGLFIVVEAPIDLN